MHIQLPGAQFVQLVRRYTDEAHPNEGVASFDSGTTRSRSELPANDRTKIDALHGKPCSCLDFSAEPRDIALSSENRLKSTQFYEHTRSNI